MRSIAWFALFGLLFLASQACTTPQGPQVTDFSITYHKDVRPILESRCVKCHKEGEIGPYKLEDYEQSYKVRELIKAQVVSRKMPPWHASQDCNEYIGDESLSDAQIDVIKKWVEHGAPEGKAADYKKMDGPIKPTLKRIDQTLKLPSFSPTGRPDDYRCFVVDWPFKEADQVRYVTGFQIKPGNTKIVHHAIAFIAPPELVDTFSKQDEEEQGPGYRCVGGPGGTTDSLIKMGWLGAWAPGAAGAVFSEDDTRGVKVQPGSKIIVQLHYNILSTEPATDQSSLEIQLTDKVQQEVKVQPWANPDWINTREMKIPAGENDVTFSFALPGTVVTGGKPVQLLSAALHMHLLGRRGKLSVVHKDGSETCMLDIKNWDFGWQRVYDLKKPIMMDKGDEMKLQCIFDNSTGNQPFIDGIRVTPQDSYWGQKTLDEMCLGIFSYVLPTP
ncbi:MAG: monooxygenase [Myxococcales bacterium]|nr:monooxygenase [Myxococcales bacterium]